MNKQKCDMFLLGQEELQNAHTSSWKLLQHATDTSTSDTKTQNLHHLPQKVRLSGI